MLNFKILLLLLISIGLDEAFNSAILEASSGQNQLSKALISIVLFGSQIIFSPIQAGFSDFSSRRKGLILAFSISLVSLLFLPFNSKSTYFIYFLFVASFLKGTGGNILPIARAGLADSIRHNFRVAIGFSTSAIAAGYVFIKVISETLDSFYAPVLLIALIPVILFYIFRIYTDRHDSDVSNRPTSFIKAMIIDIKSLYRDFLRDKIFFLSISSYFFWEVSFYLVFIKDVELRSSDFQNFSLMMCMGYLMGVLLLKLISKWHDQRVLKLGYRISIISIILIFLALGSGITLFAKFAPIFGYFIYSLGFGFIVPCLFSMVSKLRKPHEQGKIYGLIDSIDTIAFTAALLIDVYTTNFRLIMILSFICLIIGSLIYNLSHKHWRLYEEKLKS